MTITRSQRIIGSLCALLALCGIGCTEGSKPTPLLSASALHRPAKKNDTEGIQRSLLERLGGVEGLKRIADAFLTKLTVDDQLPPAFRLRFVDGDREVQLQRLMRLLGDVLKENGKSPNLDWLRSDDAGVRQQLERLLDEAAETAGVAAADRAPLVATWQKAAAALQ